MLSEKDVVVQELENARYQEKPISATAQVSGGKGEQSELERRAESGDASRRGAGTRRGGVQLLALVKVDCVGVDRVSVAGVGGRRVTRTAVGGGEGGWVANVVSLVTESIAMCGARDPRAEVIGAPGGGIITKYLCLKSAAG